MGRRRVAIRIALVVGLLLAMAGPCHADRPACAGDGPLRVLFIGNSYTYVNNLPQLFAELAAAGTPKGAAARVVAVGGATLAQLFAGPYAVPAIRTGCWDYVVLQEQSLLGGYAVNGNAVGLASFRDAVNKFDEEIRKKGARTVLFVTWARKDTPEMQSRIDEAYGKIAAETKAILAPVGDAWKQALHERPNLVLHQDDGSHPNPAGSYLAACVFYAVFFGNHLDGLPAVGIPPDQAQFLQRVTREVVPADRRL